MKIIRIDYREFIEIVIRNDAGLNIHTFTFKTVLEVQAFMNGWRSCQSVINSLVQSLPQSYETGKA